MALDVEALRHRIKDIKQTLRKTSAGGRVDNSVVHGAIQSTVSVLSATYGKDSHQVEGFIAWSKAGRG
jgi:hypothetical protein